MSERVFHAPNWTPTAQADTTALTSGTYMAVKGGSSTQMVRIKEVFISGLAGSSGAMIMQLARASTVETTPTALAAPNSDGFTDPTASALSNPTVTFVAAATGPQRSATTTDPKLELNLNAFGGIIRWRADVSNGQFWGILGNTASLGEAILSQFTGGTSNAISAHIGYEAA